MDTPTIYGMELGGYLEQPFSQETRKAMVAERLISLRKQYHLTQKEICNIIGVTPQTYSGYEKGKYEPNMETLVRLSHIFEVTTDYLLCRNNLSQVEEDDTIGEQYENQYDPEKIERINLKLSLMQAEIDELKKRHIISED